MLLLSIWNLPVVFLLSPRTLLLFWMISLGTLFVLQSNSGRMPPLETQSQSWLIIRWGQQGPGTNKLPSRLEKVCNTFLPDPITVWMRIKLPSITGLWLHLHLLGIRLFIFLSYPFPPCMCPPYCLTQNFLMMT